VLSRNYLNNTQLKYLNNDENSGNKILDYNSHEIENKFRFEEIYFAKGYKITGGLGGEYAKYYNSTFNKIAIGNREITIDYSSSFEMFKWNLFAQVSKSFLKDRLTLSMGLRSDANNYSSSMMNLLDQFSPRFSASYAVTPKWNLNFNMARYYQLPTYTTLGYRDSIGMLVNKQNNLTYIGVDNVVLGTDFIPTEKMKFSVEGFYKLYHNYPFSVRDSIPLASKGAGFGVVGDEEVLSTSTGRAYGLELFATQKMSKTINFTVSYTFVRSEFEKTKNEYIPSAWDNQHLLNVLVSKSFKKNWTVGLKWRYSGGTPYTPIDLDDSKLKLAWDVRGQAISDYSQFNALRLGASHQLDLRVDKDFYFKNFSLLLYVDVQNVYMFKADSPDLYVLNRDANGNAIIENPTDPIYQQNYSLKKLIDNSAGTLLPTIGIIVEL